MSNEKSMIMEQLHFFEELIPQIDAIYENLTLVLKQMCPVLRKKFFNPEDQALLKDIPWESFVVSCNNFNFWIAEIL